MFTTTIVVQWYQMTYIEEKLGTHSNSQWEDKAIKQFKKKSQEKNKLVLLKKKTQNAQLETVYKNNKMFSWTKAKIKSEKQQNSEKVWFSVQHWDIFWLNYWNSKLKKTTWVFGRKANTF